MTAWRVSFVVSLALAAFLFGAVVGHAANPLQCFPEDFGTIAGDGTTDDSDAINAAIQQCGGFGGGTVELRSAVYGIDKPVVVDRHNVVLHGRGKSWMTNRYGGYMPLHWVQSGGTIFQAKNSLAEMVYFRPVYNPVDGTRLMSPGMSGVILDGRTLANIGVIVESVVGGNFPDLVIDNTVGIGLYVGVTAPENLPIAGVGGAGYTEPRDTQWCDFGLVVIRNWQTAAFSNLGVLIAGDSIADVSLNHFGRMMIFHKNNAALKIGSSDANVFDFITAGRWPGGTWGAVLFMRGVGTADTPRHNHFEYIQPGVGGISVAGSGALQPAYNSLTRYSTGNGSPVLGVVTGLTTLIAQ